jgi:GTP-binding protein EngB required for normal cell division
MIAAETFDDRWLVKAGKSNAGKSILIKSCTRSTVSLPDSILLGQIRSNLC